MGIFNQEYTNDGIPLETAAITGIGNMLGAKINHYANMDLQQRQFDEQERLQQRAFQMNEQAVRNQAINMKLGMENAGLNPTGVNGAGAPAIQAGAAAGSTSALANIFTGVAEMIQAAKAPTEIEKMVAETGKTGAEEAKTKAETSAIPISIENMAASTSKLNEETRNIHNMNDILEARNDFIKDVGGSVFDGYRDTLKRSGQWEKMSTRTRNTINDLADGHIMLDIGSLEALDSIIDSQSNLSKRDSEVLHSMLDSIITNKQLNSEEIKNAMASMPKWQQNLMKAQITEFYAMANKAKTEADWNNTRNWLDQNTSDQWLIEHGMSGEIERKKYAELLNRILNLPFNVVEGASPAAIMGAAMRGNKLLEMNNRAPMPEKSRIVAPEAKGIYTINGGSWR